MHEFVNLCLSRCLSYEISWDIPFRIISQKYLSLQLEFISFSNENDKIEVVSLVLISIL